jgi:hypothetical protein
MPVLGLRPRLTGGAPHRLLLPTLLALLALPAAAQASTTQEALFQDDVQLKADPAGTLQTLKGLGVSRVRVTVNWSTIAPSATSFHKPRRFNAASPGAYPARNWTVYDAIVREAQADGIGLDFMLTGPAPLWATGRGMPRGGPYGQWKPSAREFNSFVRAVGTRYSGSYRPRGAASALPRVNFWSIWNEPNYGIDLAPQAIANDTIETGAAEYRGLLDAAWSGLRSTGHRPGRDTILIGETAPRGLDHPIGNFSGVKPLRFLRALYCVDSRYRQLRGSAAAARGCPTTASGSRRFRRQHPGLFGASGLADHPYEQNTPPNRPTSDIPGRRSDPDYADLPEVGRLEGVLDRLNRVYGSRTRFPIWNTEYGYRTRPPDPRLGVSPNTAALYINWAEYLSWRQPRLRSYMQYLLVDPPPPASFDTGLELSNGRHQPSYDAYRLPIFLPSGSARRGRSLEVWGCLRPLHATGGSSQVAIQFRSGSRGSFTTLQTVRVTNARGYFDVRVKFPSTGGVRLAWTYPSGETVSSRTAAVTIR